jgi:hypothetical protein
MDAYLVEFKAVVFADSQTDAMARVRWWRSLAAAAGWEPGQGRVSAVPPSGMTPDLQQALEKARAKSARPASDTQRDRAIAAIASHVGGDISFANAFVESIEGQGGRLSSMLANGLAKIRKRVEQPA